MNDVLVPISPGELLDKITILRIKAVRITDPAKIGNVRLELSLLEKTWKDSGCAAAEVAAENAKRAAQEVHSADEAAAHARADADAAASAARTARNAAEQADAAQVVTDAANHAAAGDYRFKPDN